MGEILAAVPTTEQWLAQPECFCLIRGKRRPTEVTQVSRHCKVFLSIACHTWVRERNQHGGHEEDRGGSDEWWTGRGDHDHDARFRNVKVTSLVGRNASLLGTAFSATRSFNSQAGVS